MRETTTRQRTKPPAASEAARKRIARAVANEIPEIGECLNPARRAACKDDLRQFCEVYFADRFNWEWSTDHLELIHAIRHCIVNGGLYLVVCPRGMGKTSLLEVAAVWATVYGHRRYIVPVCATGEDAADFLNSVKAIWESNEILAEDFPEIAEPIRRAEGISLRASRQTFNGERTFLEYSASRLAYPWLHGRPTDGRGACIEPRSITGRIRGMKRTMPDGTVQRPDFVLPDDIQTDESARSASQIKHRLGTLSTSVLGLAGPGQKIAGIMLGTIIEPRDAVDRLLHDDDHHAWGGRRMQLVYQWPEAQETLWREYAEIRKRSATVSEPEAKEVIYAEATAFYAANRAAMDKGAIVQWESRKEPDELSALQHAENKLIDRGKSAFYSEYQNDPQPAESNTAITPELVKGRINRLSRWQIPSDCEHLVAKIDVHKTRLYLVILAVAPDGTPYNVHYTTYPRAMNQDIADMHPGMSVEAAVYAALESLATTDVLPERRRLDGNPMKVKRLHVDSGWEKDVVHTWCRQGCCAGFAHPERGDRTRATDKPMAQWKKREGEYRGYHWMIRPAENGTRTVVVDTHFWKSYLYNRMLDPLGVQGAFTLFGDSEAMHDLYAEQMSAETPVTVQVQGQASRIQWTQVATKENHYFDCTVGALVAASICGATIRAQAAGTAETKPAAKPERKVNRYAY